MDFIREATLRLSYARLRFLQEAIKKDAILDGFLSRGTLKTQLTNTILELHIYETKVSIVVDCKSGNLLLSSSR